MTHPAPRNNHETHKAPIAIVKWYCPNLMGSDTSNYPPWGCWHQWTFINTQVWGSQWHGVIVELSQWGSCMSHLNMGLSSSHWGQTMPVSVQWVQWGPVSCASWCQCQCWHCHILVTLSCLAWHCVTILHHVTRTHELQAQNYVEFLVFLLVTEF